MTYIRGHIGSYKGLVDQSLEDAQREWDKDVEATADEQREGYSVEEWHGKRPSESNDWYRPAWDAAEMTHYQIYENVSEGTPITPKFASLGELREHLVTVGDDWSHGVPYTPQAADNLLGHGYAPTMMLIGGELKTWQNGGF